MRRHLLSLIDRFAEHRGISTATVSSLVFNHGKMRERLAEGSDITVGRLETAFRWFSDNWPEGAEWPEAVPRPKRTEEAA